MRRFAVLIERVESNTGVQVIVKGPKLPGAWSCSMHHTLAEAIMIATKGNNSIYDTEQEVLFPTTPKSVQVVVLNTVMFPGLKEAMRKAFDPEYIDNFGNEHLYPWDLALELVSTDPSLSDHYKEVMDTLAALHKDVAYIRFENNN